MDAVAARLPTDGTDLYIETLPSPMVRTIGIAAIVTGVTMLFSCMRFVLSGSEGTVVLVVETLLVALALVQFVVAWGVTGGRISLAVVGVAAAPLVGLLSLFVLVTGSLVGMFGGSLAIFDFVLLLLGFSKVRRMGMARRALARLQAV